MRVSSAITNRYCNASFKPGFPSDARGAAMRRTTFCVSIGALHHVPPRLV
jgi:hypothetical protein